MRRGAGRIYICVGPKSQSQTLDIFSPPPGTQTNIQTHGIQTVTSYFNK